MNSSKLSLLALVAAVTLVLSAGAFAAEKAPMTPMKTGAENAMPVTVEGVNTCIGCELMKEGAAAACSKNGHMMALRVTKAMTPDGKPVSELDGCTLHYLNNAKGMELMTDDKCHGKPVVVTGTVFKGERVLDATKIDMKDMAKMDKPMDGTMKEPMAKKKN